MRSHWLFYLLIIVLSTSITSSCPVCCRYVIFTEFSSNQTTSKDNCTCHLTMRELITFNFTAKGDNCSKKELMFQSGTYQANDNEGGSVSIKFRNISSVVIRGQQNTVIKCKYQYFSFQFIDISSIKIESIHIDECGMREGGNGLNIYIHYLLFVQMKIKDTNFTDTGIAIYSVNKTIISRSHSSIMITIEDTTFNTFFFLLGMSENVYTYFF